MTIINEQYYTPEFNDLGEFVGHRQATQEEIRRHEEATKNSRTVSYWENDRS